MKIKKIQFAGFLIRNANLYLSFIWDNITKAETLLKQECLNIKPDSTDEDDLALISIRNQLIQTRETLGKVYAVIPGRELALSMECVPQPKEAVIVAYSHHQKIIQRIIAAFDPGRKVA